MAMRNLYKEMKVKDLPAQLKPMLSIDYIKNAIKRGMDNYHAKYIQTSSLYHVCFGLVFISYLVAYPEMHRQLEHQQQAKEHGGR